MTTAVVDFFLKKERKIKIMKIGGSQMFDEHVQNSKILQNVPNRGEPTL